MSMYSKEYVSRNITMVGLVSLLELIGRVMRSSLKHETSLITSLRNFAHEVLDLEDLLLSSKGGGTWAWHRYCSATG